MRKVCPYSRRQMCHNPQRMRIIAGRDKGRKLRTLRGDTTRPTPARLREAIFSILPAMLPLATARVLDLFAGSGALGLEALSRGAIHATFVEQDTGALAVLRANVAAFSERARIIAMAAQRALPHLTAQQFSLVFVDPPYHKALLDLTLAALIQQNLVATGGVVVCEHHAKSLPPTRPCGLKLVTQRTCGDVTMIVLQA